MIAAVCGLEIEAELVLVAEDAGESLTAADGYGDHCVEGIRVWSGLTIAARIASAVRLRA